MTFHGVIIEESLRDSTVLKDVQIQSTKVVAVTPKHRTPWVKQWTMHTVAIAPEKAGDVAEKLSEALDREHSWYADFKNADTHYIIFCNKVFRVERSKPEQYLAVTEHGVRVGIPAYQVDFSSAIEEWKR